MVQIFLASHISICLANPNHNSPFPLPSSLGTQPLPPAPSLSPACLAALVPLPLCRPPTANTAARHTCQGRRISASRAGGRSRPPGPGRPLDVPTTRGRHRGGQGGRWRKAQLSSLGMLSQPWRGEDWGRHSLPSAIPVGFNGRLAWPLGAILGSQPKRHAPRDSNLRWLQATCQVRRNSEFFSTVLHAYWLLNQFLGTHLGTIDV